MVSCFVRSYWSPKFLRQLLHLVLHGRGSVGQRVPLLLDAEHGLADRRDFAVQRVVVPGKLHLGRQAPSATSPAARERAYPSAAAPAVRGLGNRVGRSSAVVARPQGLQLPGNRHGHQHDGRRRDQQRQHARAARSRRNGDRLRAGGRQRGGNGVRQRTCPRFFAAPLLERRLQPRFGTLQNLTQRQPTFPQRGRLGIQVVLADAATGGGLFESGLKFSHFIVHGSFSTSCFRRACKPRWQWLRAVPTGHCMMAAISAKLNSP